MIAFEDLSFQMFEGALDTATSTTTIPVTLKYDQIVQLKPYQTITLTSNTFEAINTA